MILLLLGILHLVGGALVADSQADFGGVQGYKGWRYRYDGGDYFDDFPTYDASWVGGTNAWQFTDSWCQIGADAMHTTTGGGDQMCSTPYLYCAPILTWMNPNPVENRSVTLTASHTYEPLDAEHDGVILSLKINGGTIETFTTPFTVTRNYGPYNISLLELLLEPKNSCNNDGTDYRIQIFAPDPSATATVTSSQTITPSYTSALTSTSSETQTPSFTGTGTPSFTATSTPSYTSTSSQTQTPSETPSQSPSFTASQTATPSETSTSSETPSFTASQTITPSETPSHTPSHTPTLTKTQTGTITPSYTPTHTPSPSATGLCNDIRNYLYGRQEIVNGGGVTFTVNHGANVTHFAPYALCGKSPTCVDNGASCVCTYTAGDSFSCNVQRRTVVTYTYGANSITYGGQTPACNYFISRSFMIPSMSPSPTVTSSVTNTPSLTSSDTTTPSVTATSSVTGICNDIRNYVNGRTESVYDTNGTVYNVFHGRYITTPYLENFDMLLGVFNGCVENGYSCLCNYNRGYNVDCPGGVARSAIVNFTYGATMQTSYYNQSSCAFVFNASYIRPSATQTATLTPTMTATWTPSPTETASKTATLTSTASQSATQTSSFTGTSSQTVTSSFTASATATSSSSATASATATQTASATVTQTPSQTATISPTVTPTGICNDVRNYVFGRRDTPTTEYTIYHGDRLTHYYYPGQYVLIGHNPVCVDYGIECVCVYDGGDPALCPTSRQGIVRYSYDDYYRTFLVNDSNPVCVYQFNTTFFLPYLSPTSTRTGTALPTPTQTITQTPTSTRTGTALPTPTQTITQTPTGTVSGTALPTNIPRFSFYSAEFIPPPRNFPNIPTNASHQQITNIAHHYIEGLNTTVAHEEFVNNLIYLASSLAGANSNLTLSLQGTGYTWMMMPAFSATPVTIGNLSATLPALDRGFTYSFLITTSNSSFPVFSVDALGSGGLKLGVADLTSPLTFSVSATPPEGQTVECVFWNGTDWDTEGCAYVNGTCACTHFTQFSARFAAIADTNAKLFGSAGEVYSLSGFVKHAAMYGTLIGLFLSLAALFLLLLRLDKKGEFAYRVTVEDIDEVCKVLGYEKSQAPQPKIHLPAPPSQSVVMRFLNAWGARILYQHSYLGIFFRYDPRLPRGFRLLLVATVAFHTLCMTTLLYGYTKVEETMTVAESFALSVITSLLNIPFIRILISCMNKVGIYEYTSRFPDFAHEYERRCAFENALRTVATHEIVRVVDRLNTGKSVLRAIQVSPAAGASQGKRNGDEYTDVSQVGDDATDTMMYVLLERLCVQYCRRKPRPSGGLSTAIEVAKNEDPHFETPSCNALPTKTLLGCAFACGAFTYIGWVMNYVLLFTASESSEAMNSIASSFGFSQATSILLTQPLTLLLTIVGTWIINKYRKTRNKNHIGYFADPSVKKGSTSLSGSWAYWIFLYGGSASSLGLTGENRSLGYSSTQVSLAWINGVTDVDLSARDAAITTLYVYLRGIQKPLTGRAAAKAAATQELKQLLTEAPQSVLVSDGVTSDEEAADLVNITKEIANTSKNA